MKSYDRRACAALGLIFLATPTSLAARQERPQPTAERAVDFLAVDFSAVSADGTPVTDLKPEDVTVRIGGRARPLRSLQLITVATTEKSAPSEGASPSPFGTNAVSENGRTLFLALDDDSFRPGREGPLRQAVDRLIGGLSPHDRIALATMPYGGTKVSFTTDHSRIRTALLQIVGQADVNQTGSALACRTRRTLESLTGHLDLLGVRELPVTVLFVTLGLAAPRRDAPMMMAPGMCELTTDMFQQVGAAAARARAQFYVIQPDHIMPVPGVTPTENIAGVGFRGSDNPVEGIEHLAGVTAGKMLQLTTSPENVVGRILRETSAYYLASVDPLPSDRSGRAQPLDVRVARQGLDVRSRPAIAFAKDGKSSSRLSTPSPREMIRVATVFHDLPLRATAYASPESDAGKLRIITIAEPVEPGVRLASLVAALFGRDGKLVSNWVATAADLARSPVVGAMAGEPGAYRLRVAAIDSQGRSGTVDYEFDAEIAQTGSLKLSSLVLGLSRDGGFVPRLQFTDEPVALGYVEMQGAAPGAQVTAALELAATLNGPAVLTVPLSIQPLKENRYMATGALPIGTLAPGDYIARAVIGLEGRPATRVVRTLRKVK
ncbi:MAG: hypothetical protein WBC51_12180 [Vicinamibacterales bacterium]